MSSYLIFTLLFSKQPTDLSSDFETDPTFFFLRHLSSLPFPYFLALSKALDSQDASQIRTATTNVLIEVAEDELNTARRISLRRSGARGADARQALLAAEKKFEQAKAE